MAGAYLYRTAGLIADEIPGAGGLWVPLWIRLLFCEKFEKI